MLRDLRQLLVHRAQADREYATKLATFTTHAEVRYSNDHASLINP